MNGCQTCGGFGMHHDPVAHGNEDLHPYRHQPYPWDVTHDAEPTWITCPTCKGDGCVRDNFDLDVTCLDCDGDGGREP